MTHPTKEEVDDIKRVSVIAGDTDITTLCDAYLALREEVERWKDRVEVRDKHIDALQADNEALREELGKVRRVLSNIDGMTVIKAKERAGYGEQVKPS